MAVPNPNLVNKPKTQIGSPAMSIPKSTVPAPGGVESAQAWINNPKSGFGGMENYAKTQNERWQQANQSGNADLMSRLQADSKAKGFTLNPYEPPKPNTTAPTQFADWQAKQNELMGKFESMMNQPFNYNPETDPGYQAQRQLAQLRAGDASRAAMETLNERGILNSSLTGSQLGQIQQRAEQEAASYIPQYRNEAYGQYQDRLRNAAEMLNFVTDRGDAAWDRDPSNPVIQGQNLLNESQGISNQIERMKLQNLPQELKLGLEALEQDVATGRINQQEAQYRLGELTDPNSITNQTKNLDLQIRQMEAANLPEQQKLELQRLRRQIADIGSAPYRSPQQIEQDKLRVQLLQEELKQFQNPTQTNQTKVDAKTSTNNYNVLIDDLDSSPNVTRTSARRLLDANRDNLTDADYKRLSDYINENF